MNIYTFALALLGLVAAFVFSLLLLRLLIARAEAKAAVARRMSQVARSRAARSRRKRVEPDDDEDEEDDDEEEADEVDEFFDLVDSNPLVGGMAKGYAAQHGLDLEAVRARDPAALLKAQALMQGANAGAAAPVNYL